MEKREELKQVYDIFTAAWRIYKTYYPPNDLHDDVYWSELADVLKKAEAEAAANEKINASLNDKVLRYQQIQKWDGKYPNVVSDSASILMNLPSDDADSSSTETPTNP